MVRRAGGDAGALALTPIGVYVQVNAGAVRTLSQRKVRAAIAAALPERDGDA